MTLLKKGSECYTYSRMLASYNEACQHANKKAVLCKVIIKQVNISLEGKCNIGYSFLLGSLSYLHYIQELHSH
jgi:hypothetical protein